MRFQSFIISILLIQSSWLFASDSQEPNDESQSVLAAISLSELAAGADLVAIAQVRDTDYIYTRSFPSEGVGILNILIQYKANRPNENFIEVYEKGLHPGECYFEDPAYTAEGRRYLVFLRIDKDDPEYYRGMETGCALEILVSEDSRYVLKYPVDGINLTDKLEDLAMEFDFRDDHALVNEDDLSPAQRDELLAGDLIVPYQGQFKYKQGIDLTTARGLIDPDALKSRKIRE